MTTPMPTAGATTPFFIMGCRRSGTTLVSQLLDSHSRLAVYHETYFYPIFQPELAWYGDLGSAGNMNRLIEDVREIIRAQRVRPPDAAEIRAAMTEPGFEGLLAALLQLYARERGAARGGDKTPEHYRFLPEIAAGFPDSPLIFVMRDPRDTVYSILRAFGTGLDDAARSWNEAWLMYERFKDRVILVRYEDLVRAPRDEVARLCDAMGESIEDDMFNFFERLPDRFRGRVGGEKLEAPVTASSIGNFRRMPEADILAIERACAAGMATMGYEFSGPPPTDLAAPVLRAPPRPPFLVNAFERLRYYGTNAERWRRGTLRWKIMLRVRARYLATLGPLRGRGARR